MNLVETIAEAIIASPCHLGTREDAFILAARTLDIVQPQIDRLTAELAAERHSHANTHREACILHERDAAARQDKRRAVEVAFREGMKARDCDYEAEFSEAWQSSQARKELGDAG